VSKGIGLYVSYANVEKFGSTARKADFHVLRRSTRSAPPGLACGIASRTSP
jgi:hypothetical protein